MTSIPLLEQIDNAGFFKRGKLDITTIDRLSLRDIGDFVEQAAALTALDQLPHETAGPFTQIASLSLGGGRSPCIAYDCRARKLRELANYAALYADHVYIQNFLTAPPSRKDVDLDEVKNLFASEIRLFASLRPLIEAGQIVPVSIRRDYCVHCLAKSAVGVDARRKIDRAYRWLLSRFKNEANVSLEAEEGLLWFNFEGPEDLVEHGSGYILIGQTPKPTGDSDPLDLRSHRLNPSERTKWGFDAHQTDEILESIAFDLNVAAQLKASFVTDRRIHIDLLERISGDDQLRRRNEILEKHLTTIVPFVNELSPTELLKLRSEEGDAFERFRKSLNTSIEAYLNQPGDFAEKDAIALRADVITPELARLNQRVKTARRKIRKTGVAKIVAWAGAITFGSYLGFIPADLVAAAKFLGLTKVAADILETFASRNAAEEEIRSEDLYFLWRVRHLSGSQ